MGQNFFNVIIAINEKELFIYNWICIKRLGDLVGWSINLVPRSSCLDGNQVLVLQLSRVIMIVIIFVIIIIIVIIIISFYNYYDPYGLKQTWTKCNLLEYIVHKILEILERLPKNWWTYEKTKVTRFMINIDLGGLQILQSYWKRHHRAMY